MCSTVFIHSRGNSSATTKLVNNMRNARAWGGIDEHVFQRVLTIKMLKEAGGQKVSLVEKLRSCAGPARKLGYVDVALIYMRVGSVYTIKLIRALAQQKTVRYLGCMWFVGF